MKRFALLLPLILIVPLFLFRSHLWTLFRPAPQVFTASQAAGQVGHYDTIVGRVAEVSLSPGGTVFLDFGAAYPKQMFTAVIPAEDVARFVGLAAFEGRTVGVTGRLDLYRGKPEIVVHRPGQLSFRNGAAL